MVARQPTEDIQFKTLCSAILLFVAGPLPEVAIHMLCERKRLIAHWSSVLTFILVAVVFSVLNDLKVILELTLTKFLCSRVQSLHPALSNVSSAIEKLASLH